MIGLFLAGMVLLALLMFVGLFGFVLANMAVVALAVLVGLAVAALFGGMNGTALVAGVAVLVLLLSRRRRRPSAGRRTHDIDATARKVEPAPAATATPLDLAWAAAAEHADWARSRLAVAQESCRLFLKVVDRVPADMEAGGLAVRIRKRIPEHVAECLDKVSLATVSERRAILDEMVFTLEKVAASAERQRTRLIGPVSGEMHVQRQHLTRDADGGPVAID